PLIFLRINRGEALPRFFLPVGWFRFRRRRGAYQCRTTVRCSSVTFRQLTGQETAHDSNTEQESNNQIKRLTLHTTNNVKKITESEIGRASCRERVQKPETVAEANKK